MVGNAFVKVIHRLEYHLYLSVDLRCGDNFPDLFRDLIVCKVAVDFLDKVLKVIGMSHALFVDLVQYVFHLSLLEQGNPSTESDKFFHSGHVNTVAIRKTDLWSRRYDYNFLRIQLIQCGKDALLQRSTPD